MNTSSRRSPWWWVGGVLGLFIFAIPNAGAQSDAEERVRVRPSGAGNVSLRLEIQRSVDRGLAWLEDQQVSETGAWGDPAQPAITALALSAILGDASLQPDADLPESAMAGLAFLAEQAKPDGGIHAGENVIANTALSMMALMQSGDPALVPLIAKGREMLLAPALWTIAHPSTSIGVSPGKLKRNRTGGFRAPDRCVAV